MKNTPYISNHQSSLLIGLAKKFFAEPNNQKEFEVWHIKEYGCMPGQRNKLKRQG